MSGHSKWANIKNRKGAQDKKRSEAFTKASKNIMTALRTGVGLTDAVAKAREVNMPKENIDRLIERFTSRKNNLVAGMLEGYGPHSVPIMVEIETDNKNRTLGEIRLIFKQFGGILGESGSVAYFFDKVGEIELENLTEEQQLILIDAGAKDFDGTTIITEPTDLKKIEEVAKTVGVVVESGIVMRPKSPIVITEAEKAGEVADLVEELEENEDVVNVFAGMDYHE